jgi:hypothetical protein
MRAIRYGQKMFLLAPLFLPNGKITPAKKERKTTAQKH